MALTADTLGSYGKMSRFWNMSSSSYFNQHVVVLRIFRISIRVGRFRQLSGRRLPEDRPFSVLRKYPPGSRVMYQRVLDEFPVEYLCCGWSYGKKKPISQWSINWERHRRNSQRQVRSSSCVTIAQRDGIEFDKDEAKLLRCMRVLLHRDCRAINNSVRYVVFSRCSRENAHTQ